MPGALPLVLRHKSSTGGGRTDGNIVFDEMGRHLSIAPITHPSSGRPLSTGWKKDYHHSQDNAWPGRMQKWERKLQNSSEATSCKWSNALSILSAAQSMENVEMPEGEVAITDAQTKKKFG